MLDFSSALYLGMRHPSHSLKPWDRLTIGKPAGLEEPEESLSAACRLAALQGCEAAVLAPSTLHLFWDLFGIFRKGRFIIYADKGLYPIARWGVERATSGGNIVRTFPHYCPDVLADMMRKDRDLHRPLLIVADGFCPSCGRPAPVSEYLSIADAHEGHLILDDTQSLGILGHSPSRYNPYGLGGGGLLRWSNNAGNPRVLIVSSMAKAFGVPVAVLSGSKKMINQFRERSGMRVHCSQPSSASLHAASHALSQNRRFGNGLRQHLLTLVRHFRKLMTRAGFALTGGVFPVQTLSKLPPDCVQALHDGLLHRGIKTVLHGGGAMKGALLGFIFTALHRLKDVDDLASAVMRLISMNHKEVCYAIQT